MHIDSYIGVYVCLCKIYMVSCILFLTRKAGPPGYDVCGLNLFGPCGLGGVFFATCLKGNNARKVYKMMEIRERNTVDYFPISS